MVEVAGWTTPGVVWSQAAKQPPAGGRQVAAVPHKQRVDKFSCGARKVLQRVWAASGGQCLRTWPYRWPPSWPCWSDTANSSMAPTKAARQYAPNCWPCLPQRSTGISNRSRRPTRSGACLPRLRPLPRSSITIRKVGDEAEQAPGFFEGDTLAHCGPSLKGEFARTLNLTCVHSGWVFIRTVRNNAHMHMLVELKAGVDAVPFEVIGAGIPR